jgi:hydroxyethylthiazole kinase-like uncharacterized protein yjeF
MSPVFIAPDNGPWPLHDAAASRRAEAAALAHAAPFALMQRAGGSAARLALALAPHASRFTVFAGPGNNGGDGLVAATQLHRAGQQVQVVLFADAARLSADAATALRDAQAAGVSITDTWDGEPGDLVIDALLGLGTNRAPDGRIAEAITRLNTTRSPVLAVDLPSGLQADTGQPLGGLAVRASATLALLTLKPGLFTGHGRDLAGTVWFDALDVATDGATAGLGGPPAQAPRAHGSHKGSYGDVAVVGGAPGMTGAAWLAATAALAAGAGRVYCSLLDTHAPLLLPGHPELMGRERCWATAPAVLNASTVACGCGGGDAVRDVLPQLLAHSGRLVLDADGLNALAGDTSLQSLLRSRTTRGRETVLTPHPLEAARLLGVTAADVQADRLRAATQLAERLGTVVVLKGSGSVIAAPGELPTINPSGNAWLATAGTGDVLAGWLAGLWAQGGSGHAAALAATWQHGHAADVAAAGGRRRPLLAGELITALQAL